MQKSDSSCFNAATFSLGIVFGMVAGVTLTLAALATAEFSGIGRHTNVTMPRSEPMATPDSRPRTLNVAGVHMGPSHDFGVLGMLARDQALDIVGRDASSKWLAIHFPPAPSRLAGSL
jgi:hypothetical protein